MEDPQNYPCHTTMARRDCTEIYGFNKVEATRSPEGIFLPKLSWWDGHDMTPGDAIIDVCEILGCSKTTWFFFTETVEVQFIGSYGTLHVFLRATVMSLYRAFSSLVILLGFSRSSMQSDCEFGCACTANTYTYLEQVQQLWRLCFMYCPSDEALQHMMKNLVTYNQHIGVLTIPPPILSRAPCHSCHRHTTSAPDLYGSLAA